MQLQVPLLLPTGRDLKAELHYTFRLGTGALSTYCTITGVTCATIEKAIECDSSTSTNTTCA